MDKQISYPWREENGGAPYYLMFLKDENTLITELQSFPLNDKEATLPAYQKRTLDTNKLLKSFSSYKKSIRNDEASILPESFSTRMMPLNRMELKWCKLWFILRN